MAQLSRIQGLAQAAAKAHPKGTYLLAVTEMWERLSYYGMRGLLVLYLTSATIDGGFGWSSAEAISLYGLYTALVYAAPVVGGYLGDNVIGRKNAIMIGCVLMTFGHFLMAGPAAVPWLMEQITSLPLQSVMENAGVRLGQVGISSANLNQIALLLPLESFESQPRAAILQTIALTYNLTSITFYAALLFLIFGTGFFKTNGYSIISELHPHTDAKRERGFLIFTASINVGAVLGNFIVGTLGEKIGWHYGFSAAGVGMVIGLLVFLWKKDAWLADVGGKAPPLMRGAPERRRLNAVELDRIRAFFVLGLFIVFFFAFFEQAGGLMNIYAYEYTDRHILGFEIPATWFQALNPIFFILFAPLVAMLWTVLERRAIELSIAQKYMLAFVLTGLSFIFMVGAALEHASGQQSNALWLVGAYLAITVGELFISPPSASLVTQYAPLGKSSLTFALWLLAISLGNWGAGHIGAMIEDVTALNIFGGIAIVCGICVCVLFALDRSIRRWMHFDVQPQQ